MQLTFRPSPLQTVDEAFSEPFLAYYDWLVPNTVLFPNLAFSEVLVTIVFPKPWSPS